MGQVRSATSPTKNPRNASNTLFPAGAVAEAGEQAFDVGLGAMLEEGQKEVLLALEVGVDRSLAAPGAGGDLIELGGIIAVPDEHFFRGIEQPGLGFPGAKLLFT